jgi:hypothetical protein
MACHVTIVTEMTTRASQLVYISIKNWGEFCKTTGLITKGRKNMSVPASGTRNKPDKQTNKQTNKQTKSVTLVHERTISTERPPLVDEVNVNFCG